MDEISAKIVKEMRDSGMRGLSWFLFDHKRRIVVTATFWNKGEFVSRVRETTLNETITEDLIPTLVRGAAVILASEDPTLPYDSYLVAQMKNCIDNPLDVAPGTLARLNEDHIAYMILKSEGLVR